MFKNKYPYTDFHELNLDWIISEMQYLKAKVKILSDKVQILEQKINEGENEE